MLSQTKEFKNCWARDIIDEKSNVLLCPDASLSLRLPNNVEKWPNILQKSCGVYKYYRPLNSKAISKPVRHLRWLFLKKLFDWALNTPLKFQKILWFWLSTKPTAVVEATWYFVYANANSKSKRTNLLDSSTFLNVPPSNI